MLMALTFAACSEAESTSTPTTAPTPTAAAVPTDAATPTNAPTATAVPTPTPAAESTVAATSTAAPSPTTGETPSESRTAGEGDRVAVHYTGTLDDGEEFDSSRGSEPLSFVVGDGRMITGFDAAVRGMTVGESRTVTMEPSEAYGERNDDLVLTFPINQLPEGVREGDSVVFTNGGQGVILEVTGGTFTVDANHRLAGQALTFEIELVSIE